MERVLKFGGTSVGSAENMRRVAAIIQNENSRITVLSAMSGTTDSLIKIVNAAKSGNANEVDEIIEQLKIKYSGPIESLINKSLAAATEKMVATFDFIRAEALNFNQDSENNIIAQGELLTSAIFTMFLNDSGIKAKLLNAPDFMHTDSDGKPIFGYLKDTLLPLVKDKDTYYVTQGFICTDYFGKSSNLGRGGSDYSAALMGEAIACDEVQIWTDIDGMHNNDPRYVQGTYPIRTMSFDEAAELAYFGAKILHPSTIQPCKEAGIPVRLKNTMDPSAEGTLITNSQDATRDFHAIAAKDNITLVRISSARMLMAYGFMRKVFEIFEKYRTPIDMITTSEVAVAITIDNDSQLPKIEAELTELGKIEIERNNTIISVVGRMEFDHAGLAASIFSGLKEVPIKMISYGASHRSLSMLIDTDNKKRTLQSLNDYLF